MKPETITQHNRAPKTCRAARPRSLHPPLRAIVYCVACSQMCLYHPLPYPAVTYRKHSPALCLCNLIQSRLYPPPLQLLDMFHNPVRYKPFSAQAGSQKVLRVTKPLCLIGLNHRFFFKHTWSCIPPFRNDGVCKLLHSTPPMHYSTSFYPPGVFDTDRT